MTEQLKSLRGPVGRRILRSLKALEARSAESHGQELGFEANVVHRNTVLGGLPWREALDELQRMAQDGLQA